MNNDLIRLIFSMLKIKLYSAFDIYDLYDRILGPRHWALPTFITNMF